MKLDRVQASLLLDDLSIALLALNARRTQSVASRVLTVAFKEVARISAKGKKQIDAVIMRRAVECFPEAVALLEAYVQKKLARAAKRCGKLSENRKPKDRKLQHSHIINIQQELGYLADDIAIILRLESLWPKMIEVKSKKAA